MTDREKADLAALAFLAANGPDTPGSIVDESVLCAYLIYINLLNRGYVERTLNGKDVTFSITQAGLDFLLLHNSEPV